jgi:isopentenyl diphosphate isomerase/L-lactate dehydrogenase-like FMN-dependent dehydrogenase
MLGRAALWGLAANGQAGVANVLEIMRAGITETLNAIDVASVGGLTADHLVIPPGFARVPPTRAPAHG